MILAKLRRRSGGGTSRTGGSTLPPTPLDSGVVSCQAHDEQGRLLPGATVSIVDRLNQQIAQGTTDSYGYFVVAVPPGPHKVSVNAGGFRRKSVKIDVRVNQHVSLGSVQLEPDASLELPQPGIWKFDPTHTEIRFIARHIGMSRIHGQFRNFDGAIRVAPRFEDSRIEVVIDAASIDTGVHNRDEHLRSGDFLDVENYPRLRFSSDRLSQVRGDHWMINGNLTLHGTTSPVELETRYLGSRRWQGPGFDSDVRVACDARTTLRREDYSVDYQATLAKGIAVIGPTIEIEMGVQAVLEQ